MFNTILLARMQHCSVTFTESLCYLSDTRPTVKLGNVLEILAGNWKTWKHLENTSLGMDILKSDSNQAFLGSICWNLLCQDRDA